MLKQVVQYTDFDGANKTKNLYFNLTRVEVIDMLDIQKEFEEIRDMIGGETRDLEMHEIKLILELVKKLMRLSYGVQKNEDGEIRFVKNEDVWQAFTETAVYDEFLIGLFEDPNKAVAFLIGIWPAELQTGIDMEKVSSMANPPAVAPPNENAESVLGGADDYTDEQLLNMPQSQFDAIFGTDPTKMLPKVLQIAFTRGFSNRS